MTKRFPYRVTVTWSAEDGVYVARIPKLEGILGLDEATQLEPSVRPLGVAGRP
jgi:hypothetical protein